LAGRAVLQYFILNNYYDALQTPAFSAARPSLMEVRTAEKSQTTPNSKTCLRNQERLK
jgi:hypothetical protein